MTPIMPGATPLRNPGDVPCPGMITRNEQCNASLEDRKADSWAQAEGLRDRN